MKTMEDAELQKKLDDGYVQYAVQINGQTVPAFYKHNWLNVKHAKVDHIEFYSHLVSETGYRSEFAFPAQIKASGGVENFIQSLALGLNAELNPKAAARKQATLF